MVTTTVWMFDTAIDAESRLLVLQGLADAGAIQVHEAVAIARLPGEKKPHVIKRGASSGADGGLDPSLVEAAMRLVHEGVSLLLAATSGADEDALRRSFGGGRGRLLSINADEEKAAQLYAWMDDAGGL